MKRTFVISVVIILGLSTTVLSQVSRTVGEDEITRVAAQLIAPCCWSQSADAHTSEAAKKMKHEIRTMLTEGRSENEIIQHYVDRYGERILSTPRARGFNLSLWIAPALMFMAGCVVLACRLRRISQKKDLPVRPAMDRSQLARIKKELNDRT